MCLVSLLLGSVRLVFGSMIFGWFRLFVYLIRVVYLVTVRLCGLCLLLCGLLLDMVCGCLLLMTFGYCVNSVVILVLWIFC